MSEIVSGVPAYEFKRYCVLCGKRLTMGLIEESLNQDNTVKHQWVNVWCPNGKMYDSPHTMVQVQTVRDGEVCGLPLDQLKEWM